LRTSRRSSPWQRARRGSDVDGETGSGRRQSMAACAQRGGGGRGVCRCANEGGREGGLGSGLKWPERGCCELHARCGRGDRGNAQLGRRLRGDEGADSRDPWAERAGERARMRESGRTDGRARRGRERRGKRRARGVGSAGPKGRGGQGCGLLSFFFYSGICFLFSFYLLYLIQIQMSHKFKLALPSIMQQPKVKFRV
jgi:hypothetical protein